MALALVLLAGCGGGDIILPEDGAPAAIAVVNGDGQRGLVGEPLANPLVVEVTDSRGRTVSGATVAFEFNASGAGAGAAVVPEEKTTDADGRAEATLVLGTTIGRQIGQARVVQSGAAAIQASFSAMALPENANTMAAVAGQDQTGHVGQPLDDRLVVEVTDNFGNPVAGVLINWAAVGGGSVSAAEVETDEDGRSRVERILGPAVGQQSTVASADGLAGSPVTFTHTALAGDASRLTIVSGNDQTGEAGETLPDELVVRLIDADGNGVPGTPVSWVVATGGGSPNPEITSTDGDGLTSTRWTLGETLGAQRLDAVVSGVGVASFRATGTAGAPASLFIRTQPSATARNGVPLNRQPVIQLRDSRGNDVSQSGVQITAAIGSGGGELGGDRQVATDGSGRATFTNLSISGAPGPRTLVFTATGYAQVTSSEIQLEAIGTTTTITGDTPDPSAVGTPFTVSFSVSSPGPTPTGSVTVSDGAQSCSGSLANGSGSCQLTLSTVGQRTLTATYTGAPGLSGSSDTESHSVEAAPPPPPAATTTTITSDTPDPSAAGTDFTVSFQVTSAGGTPTGSVTVRANGGGPTCTGTLGGGSGSCQLRLNNPGDRILTATYGGGPGFSPSEGTAPHTVSRAPVADFNWDCEDLTCFFTDNSRDDDGSITARHWNWGDGTSTENELNPQHTYAAEADYRVILTVTDNSGLTDDAEDTVDPKTPPPQVLQIERQPSDNATVGETFSRQPRIQLRAGGRDVQRAGVTITAAIASGGGTLGGSTTATTNGEGLAEFNNLSISGDAGSRTLVFSADGFGSVTSNSIDVQRAGSDIQITSHLPDPSEVGVAVRVEFSVTGDGDIDPTGNVTVTASNGDETCTGSVAQGFCEIILSAPGNRNLTATYGGDERFEGDSENEDHQVSAPNQAPTASFTATCPNLTCSFDASESDDPDGNITSYVWDFGDSSPLGSGETTSHLYTAPGGTYTVMLTVIDNGGEPSAVVTQLVTPTEPPPPAPPPSE